MLPFCFFVIFESQHCILQMKQELYFNYFSGNWIFGQGANYFVSSIKTTQEDAKKSCLSLNSSLFDIKDEHDARFLKNNVTFDGKKYWIGLSKNDSDIAEVHQNDDDIPITEGECLVARMNSSSRWQFLKRPCNWLRTSFCVRPRQNQEDEETGKL